MFLNKNTYKMTLETEPLIAKTKTSYVEYSDHNINMSPFILCKFIILWLIIILLLGFGLLLILTSKGSIIVECNTCDGLLKYIAYHDNKNTT